MKLPLRCFLCKRYNLRFGHPSRVRRVAPVDRQVGVPSRGKVYFKRNSLETLDIVISGYPLLVRTYLLNRCTWVYCKLSLSSLYEY